MKVLLVIIAMVIGYCMISRAFPPTTTESARVGITTLDRNRCSTSDITVRIENLRKRYDYSYATGRIINNCAIAIGVQLKFTTYGKNGEILKVDDTWPASTNNIPARSEFPFEHQTDWVPGATNMDARVIATRIW